MGDSSWKGRRRTCNILLFPWRSLPLNGGTGRCQRLEHGISDKKDNLYTIKSCIGTLLIERHDETIVTIHIHVDYCTKHT